MDMLLEIFWNYKKPQNSKFALTLISTMYICTHTYMSEKQLLNADAINLTHIKILEGELLWQVKDDHNGSFENPLEHIQIQIKVTQSKRLSLKRQKMKFISCRFLMHPAGSGVSFSSCQRNLIKTFQIEAMMSLITKMALIFSWDLLNGQK